MAYSGLNLGNVKNQNRSSILKLLNDHGPMPRKDLSARLGLTPASLTTLCGELLAQNILFELGEVQQEDKRAGPPPPVSPCVTCGESTASPAASPRIPAWSRRCF